MWYRETHCPHGSLGPGTPCLQHASPAASPRLSKVAEANPVLHDQVTKVLKSQVCPNWRCETSLDCDIRKFFLEAGLHKVQHEGITAHGHYCHHHRLDSVSQKLISLGLGLHGLWHMGVSYQQLPSMWEVLAIISFSTSADWKIISFCLFVLCIHTHCSPRSPCNKHPLSSRSHLRNNMKAVARIMLTSLETCLSFTLS